MKPVHYIIGALACLGLFCAVYACDGYMMGGDVNGEGVRHVSITAIEVGRMQKPEKHNLFDELKDREDEFVGFTSQTKYDEMQAEADKGKITLEEGTVLRNKLEFSSSDRIALKVRTRPEDAAVSDVIAVSSNDSVLHIVGYNPFEGIIVETGKFGDADLTVTVKGSKNEITEVFPIRVVATIETQFRITPFWLGNVKSKVKVKFKRFPDDVKSCILYTTDSIEVCGYCEYYTPLQDNYHMDMHWKRDTIRYPLYSRVLLYKKGKVKVLRDITESLQEVRSWRVKGQKLNDGSTFSDSVFITHYYPYKVEQVTLFYDVIVDNPFVDYDVSVRCKHTVTTHERGKGEEEEEPDEDYEDEEDPDDVSPLEEKEQPYFAVRFNDHLTQAQRDSINNRIEEIKQEEGWKDDLPDSLKQQTADKIDEKMK